MQEEVLQEEFKDEQLLIFDAIVMAFQLTQCS
jgi:hypothetical protein